MPKRCPTCGRTHRRSNPANARYWALLHEIADSVKTADGKFGTEVWHGYFKSGFLGCEEVKLPNRKVLQIPRSSAELDNAEFSEYMMQVEVWANEHGVYLSE